MPAFAHASTSGIPYLRYGPTVVATTRVLSASAFIELGIRRVGDDRRPVLPELGPHPLELLLRAAGEPDPDIPRGVLREVLGGQLPDEPGCAKDDDVQLPICLHWRRRYMARLGRSFPIGRNPLKHTKQSESQ